MSKTLIIAEAGVNHNGDINIAKKLIDTACEAGCDVVKFQTFKVDSLVSRAASLADYQKKNTGKDESQKEMLSRLSLSYEDFETLKKYCDNKAIEFLSTPFDIESIHFLDDLVNFWKIPSGEITDYPYLVEIAKTHKKVILSTGMSSLDEVEAAVSLLRLNGACDISLLHCTTEYPAPFDSVNLKAMNTLKTRFNVPVGYSDHTKGISIPIAAVAMGASIIEKHFTLDRNMEGPDHKASLEPNELKEMVDAIRNVEDSLGDGIKVIQNAESQNKSVVRKSIVAKTDIKKGDTFTENNITTKRPGTGLNPMKWPDVIGKKATKNYTADELIEIDKL
ncbi:N-acetylneuraminate synthase [Butyrivibrio fibrisolvens]|uniref:N-acetylneuraminate synthase n=1 Tax=Butyrivibrio fibrisolvens TaxID=831 RepID=UPI00200A5404|nr:N-acetylneuraminate synthase [Butyrivibrio fibrisolvens]